jgi:Sec-independent protein secretion pathway component TatC
MIVLSNFKINILELKIRLFYSILSFFITILVSFNYRTEFFFFISKRILNRKNEFIYINLLDPIYLYIKIIFAFSIFFTLPFIIYLIISFIFKGLYIFYVKILMLMLSIYYLINLLLLYFCYTKLFPILINFLLELERKNINTIQLVLLPTSLDYLKFFINFLIFFHILFALINIFFIFHNFFSYKKFKNKKYVYLLTFIIFIVIAPPDLFIQISILPIIILIIEVSSYLSLFFFNILKKNK